MQPATYTVGPSCSVKDKTNGALGVEAARPFLSNGMLLYRLIIKGSHVLLQPNFNYHIADARKITLYYDGDLLAAKIKFEEGEVRVVKIDPLTRLIKN